MEYRVNLCEAAPQAVLRIPLEIRPERLADGMRRVAEIAQRAGLTASGAPTLTFHHELPVRDTITVDFGLPTEAYLIGPDEVSDPRRLITEIRIPVAPAPAMAAHLDLPFDDARRRVRAELRHHGFGILTETDVQAELREQAGDPALTEVVRRRRGAQLNTL